MSKTKKIAIVVIILLFSLYNLYNISKLEYLEQDNNLYGIELILENVFDLKLKLENSSLSPAILLRTESGDTIALKQLVKDSAKLIFKYSEITCNSCVDNEVNNLVNFARNNDSKTIIVIGEYSNIRELNIFKRINKIDLPVYNLISSESFTKVNLNGLPLLFVLSPDLVISNVYIPLKELPKLSRPYYSSIAKLLYSN